MKIYLVPRIERTSSRVVFMNIKGKKIGVAGTIFLLVVLLPTIMVAAYVLMGETSWTNTVSDGATVSKVAPVYDGIALPDNPTKGVTYEFGVQVAGQSTGTGTLFLQISKAEIASSDVVLSYTTDGTTWTPLSADTSTSGQLTYTCPTSVDLTATQTFSFQITYETSGVYNVLAYVNQ